MNSRSTLRLPARIHGRVFTTSSFAGWPTRTRRFPTTPAIESGFSTHGGTTVAYPVIHVCSNGLLNYDTDITLLGSYCSTFTSDCLIDANIGGTDDNFQRFLVTQTPAVPEPATLFLLGTGVTSLLYHRRRRRRDSGAGART